MVDAAVKPELVLMRTIYAPTIAELEREFVVHKPWTAEEPEAFIRRECGNARAAITTTPAGFSRHDFDAFPILEFLGCFGPYYDLIDLAAAKERGITVTYTPGSTAEPVADLALGLIIAVMRRLCEGDRFIRAGKWPAGVFDSGREVRGKACGVVGMGRIGREIGRLASAFGMHVCYHGPRRKDDVPYSYAEDLAGMACESDVLVVACPLTPATCNLIDARILRALGPDGFLVNVARGAIVEEAALIEALRTGQIAGAALDVFHDEPKVPRELMRMENVVLAPHIGTSTVEIREGRSAKLLGDLRAHFSGKPPSYPVEANN